jgi:hypothetical protein
MLAKAMMVFDVHIAADFGQQRITVVFLQIVELGSRSPARDANNVRRTRCDETHEGSTMTEASLCQHEKANVPAEAAVAKHTELSMPGILEMDCREEQKTETRKRRRSILN